MEMTAKVRTDKTKLAPGPAIAINILLQFDSSKKLFDRLLIGWPTTSWLVAAGFCFGRSSRRMFRWLLTNRVFGNVLLEYYVAGRALPLHSKIVIIGIISVVSAFSIYIVTKLGDPGFGQTTIAIVAVIGIWFVGWKVPTVQLQPQPN